VVVGAQITDEAFRSHAREQARTADLANLLPGGRDSVLDAGAKDGHFSRLMAGRYRHVTAIDLERPSFRIPGVPALQADICRLPFADASFDFVFCAEVIEHIPDVAQACRELARVARHELLIGVPFQQDTRLFRTTCSACGRHNPGWGHVQSFTEQRLRELFPGFRVATRTLVWSTSEATNALSAALMDLAGNPKGIYSDTGFTCTHCGAKLVRPRNIGPWRWILSTFAHVLNRLQTRLLTRAKPQWIHIVFSRAD